jgi:hypothetical protein
MKSGAEYRMTRIGATAKRLERFAECAKFEHHLSEDAVEQACQNGTNTSGPLTLKNPRGKKW